MLEPPAINSNTFTNRSNSTLYVPYGCKKAYVKADYWKEFEKIVEVGDVLAGDADGNGDVNFMDVQALIDYVLDKPSDSFVFDAADINGDKIVSIADIVEIVNIILDRND